MLEKQNQDFVTALGKELKSTFPELGDKIVLLLLVKNTKQKFPWMVNGRNQNWTGYFDSPLDDNTGNRCMKSWIERFLEKMDDLGYVSDESVRAAFKNSSCEYDLLYLACESGKKDSRIESRTCAGAKDLIWVVLGKVRKESWLILLDIIMKKTMGRISDLFIFSCWRDDVHISNNLFEYVREKDFIMKSYALKVFQKTGITDPALISMISSQRYEGQELYSRVYFGDCDNIHMQLSFQGENEEMWNFSAGNLRFIRKILETAKNGRALAVDMKESAMTIRGVAQIKEELGVQVVFQGYLKWTLKCGGEELICYENGIYQLPEETAKGEYQEKMKLLGLKYEDRNRIVSVIEGLRKQKHGTSVVFLDNGVLERVLTRLVNANRACRVQKISMCQMFQACNNVEEDEKKRQFQEFMVDISAIDGALIADFEGNIHAIGALLDGEAVVKADVSRGARYNSLQNYINWLVVHKICKKDQCFAVIISEDEMLNLEVANENNWIVAE